MAGNKKGPVSEIRRLLHRLADSRNCSNDEQEVVHDEVIVEFRKLPLDGIVDAIDKAAGNNKKLRRETVYLLSELTELPEAVDRIGQQLTSPDPRWRDWLIQTIGHAGLKQLAPHLNNIMLHDPDDHCRRSAVSAASKLRCPCNLPSILQLAEKDLWEVLWALKEYATPECRPYLERVFGDPKNPKADRIIAAWGLGKLGNREVIPFLVEMLFDPDKHRPDGYSPGESMRAAQAICNLNGWEFHWNKTFVVNNRDTWKTQLLAIPSAESQASTRIIDG